MGKMLSRLWKGLQFWKSKESPPEQDNLREERWKLSLDREQELRLELGEQEDYSLEKGTEGLVLELKREHLFAWPENPWFQYGNFFLEAQLGFDSPGAHYSLGFRFRATTEQNFYYFLVSSRGYFRFDVVFNGHPRTLIPWTLWQENPPAVLDLQIIARGTVMNFYLEKEWVAEAVDDTLEAGRLTLCGQNYGENPRVRGSLRSLVLESRRLEVETQYYRWTETLGASPGRRLALARSLETQGYHREASRQLFQALRDWPEQENGEGERRTAVLMLLDNLLQAGEWSRTRSVLDRELEKKPGDRELSLRKAELLYLTNRFLELRDYIQEREELWEDDSRIWNLLGHGEYELRNWESARAAYDRALVLAPEEALVLINRSRAEIRLGQRLEGARGLFRAARMLFLRQEYTAMEDLLLELRDLKGLPEAELRSLEAQVSYLRNEPEAHRLLEEAYKGLCPGGLAAPEVVDPALALLLGISYLKRGQAELSLPFLEEAIKAVPDFALAHLKLAEARREAGLDPLPQALKARELAPEDPWCWNLLGLLEQEPEQRREHFSRARDLAPDSPEILCNLAQALLDCGRHPEARELLEKLPGDARAWNIKGHIHSRLEDWPQAQRAYNRALGLDPSQADYWKNAVESALVQEDYLEAESLLIRFVEREPSAWAYLELGRIIAQQGDWPRAEVIFKTGEALDPESLEFPLSRALLHFNGLRYPRVREILEDLLKRAPGDSRVLDLQQRLRRLTCEKIHCSRCNREWWVPLDLPPQGPVKIQGEPPAEAPAGRSAASGRIYCVGCAQEYLRENRFYCPEGQDFLKLDDPRLRYLLREALSSSGS